MLLWLSNLVISSKRTFETIKYMKKEDMKIHDNFVLIFFFIICTQLFLFLYILDCHCVLSGALGLIVNLKMKSKILKLPDSKSLSAFKEMEWDC